MEILGLCPGHAYSLLDIYELETNQGLVKLIKLRNPWGNREWQGDWSYNSSLWT